MKAGGKTGALHISFDTSSRYALCGVMQLGIGCDGGGSGGWEVYCVSGICVHYNILHHTARQRNTLQRNTPPGREVHCVAGVHAHCNPL